jgi:hypothetical protein
MRNAKKNDKDRYAYCALRAVAARGAGALTPAFTVVAGKLRPGV